MATQSGYAPKGTVSWTCSVVRSFSSKAKTYDSGHWPTEAEAIAQCLYRMDTERGKAGTHVSTTQWTATGDGCAQCEIFGGAGRRLTVEDARNAAASSREAAGAAS